MDRLEDEIRSEESPDDLVLLLRGGEDGEEKLLRQATSMATRFTYAGKPSRGISLFAADGDLDTWVLLGSRFRTFRTYRCVDGATLAEHGLLLPTFGRPHWTLMFLTPNGNEVDERVYLAELLAILGPVLDNPKYEPTRTRRRR